MITSSALNVPRTGGGSNHSLNTVGKRSSSYDWTAAFGGQQQQQQQQQQSAELSAVAQVAAAAVQINSTIFR